MAPLDSPFSRPSTTAAGMGALSVLAVGAIATGLWYDSHRGAEAVEQAREQVSAAQVAPPTPEPVAVTTPELPTSAPTTSDEPGSGPSSEPSVDETPATLSVAVPYAAPADATPTVAAARPAPAVANPAPAVANPAPAAPAPAVGQGPAGTPPAGDPTTRETTQPGSPVLEVTRPGDTGFVPLPLLPDRFRPFVPQADAARQAPAAVDGAEG